MRCSHSHGMSTHNRIKLRDLWAYHSSTLYSHSYTQKRANVARMLFSTLILLLLLMLLRHRHTLYVRANIENGRMVKRATAPDWFVCWGVISSFLSSTNERFAFNMRSENNYVIEIGNRKREMVGFSNRNMYRFKCASTVIFHGRFMPRLYHCCFTFVIVLFRRFYRTMVIVIMAVIIGSMNTYVSVYDEVYFHLLNWETVVRFTERSLNQIIFATFKYEYYEPNTLNGFALANQSFDKSLDQITF